MPEIGQDLVPGSIPACTGEPAAVSLTRVRGRVYPRVYGGTQMLSPFVPVPTGLSPRVRGNRHRCGAKPGLQRSIPACTGEPQNDFPPHGMGAVYPRVYGGTAYNGHTRTFLTGLSPRVRGNRREFAGCFRHLRSIPACTGEPTAAGRDTAHGKVYPRVYGGTISVELLELFIRGLSPRVRGNRSPSIWIPKYRRSIPACTGEPVSPPRLPGSK